jgi:hypothetical protein
VDHPRSDFLPDTPVDLVGKALTVGGVAALLAPLALARLRRRRAAGGERPSPSHV